MTDKKAGFPEDKTAHERRKNLTEEELKELELAGGVEGGMQAGSAGGPAADGGRTTPRKSKD
jgi:hypothetical protein